MFALTLEGGMCLAPMDVCNTPAPAGPPAPVPYPNVGRPILAWPVTTKVRIRGVPALTRTSVIQLSSGDEPGLAGGVVSGTVMGSIRFDTASAKVHFEGNPAVRLGDQTRHNEGNAIGSVVQPGQCHVDIRS